MRYSSDHKKKTRDRILQAARRLFREKGYNGVGVDAIMAEVGLTAGGFYAHFASKESLFSEALSSTPPLPEERDSAPEAPGIGALVRSYLSRRHRENVAEGCPLPSLAPDVVRGSDEARANFERILFGLLEKIERGGSADAEVSRESSLALAGQLVGGLMLSRAVKDGKLSDEILKACREAALRIPVESPAGKEGQSFKDASI